MEFVECNNLRVMNAFVRKRKKRKWTWRDPNGDIIIAKRRKMLRKMTINELAVKGNTDEFRIALQNRYSAFPEEDNVGVQVINDTLTGIITECAREAGGKVATNDTGKLSQKAKDVLNKRQSIKSPIKEIE